MAFAQQRASVALLCTGAKTRARHRVFCLNTTALGIVTDIIRLVREQEGKLIKLTHCIHWSCCMNIEGLPSFSFQSIHFFFHCLYTGSLHAFSFYSAFQSSGFEYFSIKDIYCNKMQCRFVRDYATFDQVLSHKSPNEEKCFWVLLWQKLCQSILATRTVSATWG